MSRLVKEEGGRNYGMKFGNHHHPLHKDDDDDDDDHEGTS
jgi:hypothetical protein